MRKPQRTTPKELAWEILAYLERVPTAMDTLENIALWWLSEQRIIQTNEEVQAALDMLVQKGLVHIWKGPDGRLLYRFNPEKKEEARQLLYRQSTSKKASQSVQPKEQQ